MKKLVIVESPTKAKTLTGILGKEYDIKASMGHIRDLPKSGLGVDLENNFAPEYIVPEKAKKTVTELKKLAQDSTEIILATDPDREGEAIAWHLSQLLSNSKKKTKKTTTKKTDKTKKTIASKTKETLEVTPDTGKFERVVFHELTKEAVLEAFSHPSTLNMELVDAQQARRILDRLVGYKLSPLLWKKVRYGLSAGRVQSVAVRLIVERERERLAFEPVEYWSVEGKFSSDDNKKVAAQLVEFQNKKLEIKSSEEATKITKELKNDSFSVSSVKKSEKQRKPYAPFKTSTLQQTASNVFGFSAKRTMIAAQKLFENGYITYHRTDSLNLSTTFIDGVRSFVKSQLGNKYVPAEPVLYKTNSKNAQEAHEAIRPTDIKTDITTFKAKGLSEDEQKLYSLIWKRSIECEMSPAEYHQTTLSINSDKGYMFRASGSIVTFEGWLALGKLIGIDIDEEEVSYLPDFETGTVLHLDNIIPTQHFTQPPARYSDASIVKALEELGVGRPSTYAPTISTIITRGYVIREGRYFVPTDVAYVVTDLLVNHFKDVVDYKFTADLEEKLDEIADGEITWVPVIKEFYEPFEKNLNVKEKQLQKSEVTMLGETSDKCPDCGKNLMIKLGKYGKFLSCTGYPDCSYARPIEEVTTIGVDGEEQRKDYGKCPNCEDGVFILKTGRFGKFLACSNYPKCKTTQKYLEKIGMKCPKCADGEVIVKKAKGRVFYGCSKYPECDYSSWKNPLKKSDAEEGDSAEATD